MRALRQGFSAFAVGTFAWLAGSLGGSCAPTDCELYGTCADSLHDRAIENFAAAGEECIECIDACRHEFEKCSENTECNYKARCRLATGPRAYQKCLEALSEEYVDGTVQMRRPWEGSSGPEAFEDFTNCFGECHTRCREPLSWQCKPAVTVETNSPLTVRLAVRVYPYFGHAKCVRVQACTDDSTRQCSPEGTTSDDGRVDLELPPVNRDSVYFKLEPNSKCRDGKATEDFPPTRFYPGYLSGAADQPIEVYILNNATIKEANGDLEYGEQVLEKRGQSLILTDSCVWNNIAAAGVKIHAQRDNENEDENGIKQCNDMPCTCADDTENCACPPCIWYADDLKRPTRRLKQTLETGAGIVGLEKGRYIVSVHADGRTVSNRRFEIDAGEMVVLRTWPN